MLGIASIELNQVSIHPSNPEKPFVFKELVYFCLFQAVNCNERTGNFSPSFNANSLFLSTSQHQATLMDVSPYPSSWAYPFIFFSVVPRTITTT